MTDMQKEHFFDLPGLQDEADRFRKMLDVHGGSDHILIKGPRGSGKSYFSQVYTKHYPKQNAPLRVNCASIHPALMASELFGYVKGAFTGADENHAGIIKTAYDNKQPLLLEEFNSLAREHQAQLLVYMETGSILPVGSRTPIQAPVQIIATMNFETETEVRRDIVDRFRIILTVPPLYERRADILVFIAEKYPDLPMDKIELLSIYAHHWPGNLRELDRVLFEMKAGLGLRKDILKKGRDGQVAVFNTFISNNEWNLKDFTRTGYKLFKGIIPWEITEIFAEPYDPRWEEHGYHKHFLKKVRISKNENFCIITFIPSTNSDKDCTVPADLLGSYFLHLRLDDRHNGSLFDNINGKESRESDFFTLLKKGRVVDPTGIFKELNPDLVTDDFNFTPAMESFIIKLGNALIRRAPEITEHRPEVTKKQVMEHILKLGNYSKVEGFLYSEAVKILGSQKNLAEHWGVPTSTLNARIKRLKQD